MTRSLGLSLGITVAGVFSTLVGPQLSSAHDPINHQLADSHRLDAETKTDASSYLERAELHRRDRNWKAALADLEQASQIDPLSIQLHYFRGRVLLDSHQYEQAEASFEIYLELLSTSKSEPNRAAGAYLLLGRTTTELGCHLTAAAHFRRSIELHSRPRPETFILCAEAFAAAGPEHVGKALDCLEEGLARLGRSAALEHYSNRIGEEIQRSHRGTSTRPALPTPSLFRQPQLGPLDPGFATAMRHGKVDDLGVGVELIRGPYLQLLTSEGAAVRWRTSEPTDSWVRYGVEAGNPNRYAFDPELTTEHIIHIPDLDPNTTHFYSVGSSALVLSGGDQSTFFVTAPRPAESYPTRIWVIGDSGTANADARAVRDAYRSYSAGRHTDVWMMLGDNAYGSGTDAEYQAAVFETYPTLLKQTAVWPALGNHDGISADSATQAGPYYDIFSLPTLAEAGGLASGTEAYYSFDFGNLHFVVLDSHETDRAPDGAMLLWLTADLAANDADWTVASWHHPPYTKGSHDSDTEIQLIEMRENVLPILDDHGVDLVLTGHSHSYERSFLLDGHYGTSDTLGTTMLVDDSSGAPHAGYFKPTPGPAPHEGAVYAVAGSSGRLGGGPLDHPAMFVSLNQLGSLVIDIDGRVLDGRFLDSVGNISDHFRIVKGFDHPPLFSDSFESGTFSAWSAVISGAHHPRADPKRGKAQSPRPR